MKQYMKKYFSKKYNTLSYFQGALVFRSWHANPQVQNIAKDTKAEAKATNKMYLEEVVTKSW